MPPSLIKFLFGPFLIWLPIVFFGLIFILLAFFYFRNKKNSSSPRRSYLILIICTLVFRILYPTLLSVCQYWWWRGSTLTDFLLHIQLNPDVSYIPLYGFFNWCGNVLNYKAGGYFLYYCFGRFYLKDFISIGLALFFYIFLRLINKYRPHIIEAHEAELGFLSALLVGWPQFVIFLPLIFITAIFTSIFYQIIYKKNNTTLSLPLLLALFATLVLGDMVIRFLGLSYLYI